MPIINGIDVRTVLLKVINELNPSDPNTGNLQDLSVLTEAKRRLDIQALDINSQQILLTEWYELFRTGYLSWGHSVSNPNPPFCHLTLRGERLLENMIRDPGNPNGYIAHIDSLTTINDISRSYLLEGLDCYVAASFKAAAVMIGAASESLILALRDKIIEKNNDLGRAQPNGLTNWKMRTIINSMKSFFDPLKRLFPQRLREGYEAYWLAFTQQIRAVRNEVGHPSSIDPITPDTVHASFLVFPEIARLSGELERWVEVEYT